MKSKWFWAVLVALAGLVVYVGNVFATPSTGYASSTLAKAQFGELDSHLHSVPADWQEMIKTPTFWVMYAMFVMVATGGLMAVAQLGLIANDSDATPQVAPAPSSAAS